MMRPSGKPFSVVVYQDVLCSWSYLARLRLDGVARELAGVVRVQCRSFPLRVHDTLPSPKELKHARLEVLRAQREPDGTALTADLWSGLDVPRSSLTALAAVEAARLQGEERAWELGRLMQRAALEQGVNVTRSDVVFELAERANLQMNRFSAAYNSQETKKLILQEYRMANARGVWGVPTLVVGSRWMLSGLRAASEYRDLILGCLAKAERTPERGVESTVH